MQTERGVRKLVRIRKRLTIYWVPFFAAFLLVACGVQSVEEESPAEPAVIEQPTEAELAQLPTSTPSATATVEPTLVPPTATPIPPTVTPPPTPTPTEKPTAVPSATPSTNIATPTDGSAADEGTASGTVEGEDEGVAERIIAGGPWPTLFYIPFSFGNFGEPILSLQDGSVTYTESPIEIETFFEYDPIGGQILYGSRFWEPAENNTDSVTDLLVYSYQTERAETIYDGNVGRAAWAIPSAADQADPPGVRFVVALHNGVDFDLILYEDGGEREIDEAISPFFSYHAESDQVAYVKDEQLFVADLAGREIEETMATGVYAESGWVGDAPTWGTDELGQFLIYADNPISIVRLGRSAPSFSPTNLDQSPLEEFRPLQMLWSASLNQLIVVEDGFGQSVRVYLLAEDLSFVEDSYLLESVELAGWYQDDRSILVVDPALGPQVWSLENYEFGEAE